MREKIMGEVIINGKVCTIFEMCPAPGLSEVGLAIEETERKERKERKQSWKERARYEQRARFNYRKK